MSNVQFDIKMRQKHPSFVETGSCFDATNSKHINAVWSIDNNANTDRYVSRTGMTWTDNESNTGTCSGTSGLTGCHSDKGNWYRLWSTEANWEEGPDPME